MPATPPPSSPPPNWGPTPPSPQGWSSQPPPNWTMPPHGWAPGQPTFMSRPGSMDMLSRLAKVIGLALVFVGVLLVTVGGSVPGSCFSTGTNCGPTGTNFPSQLANSILVGKALFVIGLTAFAMGAFLKMRGLQNPASGKREDLDYVIADRKFNGYLVMLCLFLLAVTLYTVNVWPPIPIP